MNLRESYIFQHAYAGRPDDLARALRKIGELSAGLDSHGNTPLMAAAIGGCPHCVRALLPFSNPKQSTPNGDALMAACRHGQILAAKTLLPHSSPRAHATRDKLTALHIASQNGSAELVALLLPHSDVHQADARGMTALAWACRAGHAQAVDILARAYDFDNAPSNQGLHPLLLACAHQRADCLSVLLAVRPQLASLRMDALHRTPLMMAAAHQSAACIGALLPLSNASAVDISGRTALMLAAERGYALCVELLAQSSPIDARDLEGQTAHQLASVGGHSLAASILESRATSLELARSASVPPQKPSSRVRI